VENSDVVLVCLSNGSINRRGYVQKELRFALDIALEMPEETIFIVPLRLEECTPPRSLRDWQYADYFEGQRDRALQRLLVSLKRRANSLGLEIEESTPKEKEVEKDGDLAFLERRAKYGGKLEDNYSDKLILSNGMEFMCIPAGKFIMGSNDGERNEKPQHLVDIPYNYWMARFLVTNEQYNAYMKSKRSKHPVSGWEKKKDHPITCVYFPGAYCQWLGNLFRAELPAGLVLRLPTEAEWEKAARGTDGLEYPWGNKFDQNKCNTGKGEKGSTTSVGLYSPKGDSGYGCADMSGNVWEETHSLMDKAYPYNIEDGREDEKISGVHVMRGGSFDSYERTARCACRNGAIYSELDYSNVGFRVCLAPPLPK
jgi:formylglycine-generating enzyme required for sulfatase activity